MKKCPHCGKDVEALRGECPHCHQDLNQEGFREMLTGIQTNTEATKRTTDELRSEAEAQKKRLEYVEEQLKKSARADASGSDRPKPVNMMNVVRGIMLKDFTPFPYEHEVIKNNQERMMAERGDMNQQRKRALDSGAVGTGGAIIPPEYLPQEMIDLLRAKLFAEMLGARTLSDLSGSPVTIPRLASGATVYDVAENNAKTPSDQGFELLSLSPHEVAAATVYSKRMALLSNPSVDRLIQDDLTKALATWINWLTLFGGLAPNQAVGIINTIGIGTYTLGADVGNGAVPIATDVDGIEFTLENANADMGKLGWVWSPRTKRTFKQMRNDAGGVAGTGDFLWREDIKAGKMDGYPMASTTLIANNYVKGGSNDCSYIVYGNWDDFILAYWGGLELQASDQAGDTFLKNQVVIKCSMLYDLAVRHEASFVVTDGVRA